MPRAKHLPTGEEKLKRIRTLYMLVYNDEKSLVPLAIELFHALGEILEGTEPTNLTLNRINKHNFLHELSAEN